MDDLKTHTQNTTMVVSSEAPGSPLVLGGASAVVTLAMLVVTAHDAGERWMMAPVILLGVALVWGLVVPRALRSGRVGVPAVWLAGLALPLTVVAFWAHVPFVLAAGGAYLGWVGRQADRGAGLSIAALVLGLLAMLAYVATIVLDALAI